MFKMQGLLKKSQKLRTYKDQASTTQLLLKISIMNFVDTTINNRFSKVWL